MSEYVRTAPARLTGKPEAGTSQGGQKLLMAGGILAALGASSCCILPLVLFSIGVSGAWIGNLTALAPYQPVFVVAALVFLAVGFWRVYRQPKVDCAEGSACARPGASRIAKIGLWAATVLVFAAMAFPYAVPFLLDL
ncbi:mercuric transporter MerT family protein [Sphingobium sp. SA2]|uniref:Mercuric transport protein MerT n=2 Tax=Sphingomonas TaxID=13687 RepID=A0A7T3E713_SPHPI|nr:mercury transporter MerT [Brucella anthropi]NJB99225.1 mercuric ion transport protein [Sphingomonas trueperi]QPT10165.1 mercury transporter MerT [Sphingomonas paucimobilis]